MKSSLHTAAPEVDLPALPIAEPWVQRWSRRAVSHLSVLVLFAVVGGTLPITVPLAAVVDLVRRSRWAMARFLLVVFIYLACEVTGVALSAGVWLLRAAGGSQERFLARNFRLQCWWVRTIFETAAKVFGARLEVEGLDQVSKGPLLLLIRHASLVDTLIPGQLVSARFGLRLRYVLKRELLWDPCLDVVGHRLPNAFVARGGETHRDLAAVRKLTEDLGPSDGVMIFPEGTRFSPARRARALRRLAESAPPALLARAEHLTHTLPPRLGGVLTVLDERPDLDVAFCSHRGLGEVRSFADLVNGTLVGRTISVRFWRCASAAIPTSRDARVDWLYDQWAEVDAFIADRSRGRAP